MTLGLADENGQFARPAAGEAITSAANATALALGPGIGRSDTLVEFVEAVYSVVSVPMVVDADALYALSQKPQALASPGRVRVLTPHAGEFERLTGQRLNPAKRVEVAAEFARGADDIHYEFRQKNGESANLIVVLKGHETVVTDGRRFAINQTGNPGMATGGAGDVLTGIITGLLCQGLEPFDAARLGAYLHGLAGDLAAEILGQASLIATDIIDYLPQAFHAFANKIR
jgi:NAD(P)H-hydrate epimerase